MKKTLFIFFGIILIGCGSDNAEVIFSEAVASEVPHVIPLNEKGKWEVLTYSKISTNQVKFSDQGLTIEVNKSASPVIYPFKKPILVKKVQVKGEVKNQIQFNQGVQGEKGFDDYLFRIGLVIQGKQTLNFAQKLVAADWVKRLFNLAPKGIGVSHIYFLNLGSHEPHLGRVRNHPLSELIKEEVVILSSGSEFSIDKAFKEPKQVLALWISVDGDDTKSQFTTHIKSITLQ